jgi:hypothetical protein
MILFCQALGGKIASVNDPLPSISVCFSRTGYYAHALVFLDAVFIPAWAKLLRNLTK